MIKQDIILNIAARNNLSEKQSRRILNTLLLTIIKGVDEDGECKIVGFGRFTAKLVKAKEIVSGRTGLPIVIPPYRRIHFKPTLRFKRTLKISDSHKYHCNKKLWEIKDDE